MKAISPLIATVLLIGIVIAASVMIYIWSKGFMKEQLEKFGESIDVACHKVAFEAHIVAKGQNIYELVINNQGNIGINKINIKVIKGGKSIEQTLSPEGGIIEKGGTGIMSFNLEEFGFESFEKIDVTPMLFGEGKTSREIKLHACKDEAKKGLRAEVGY